MINNGPITVSYHWSFLKRPPEQRVDILQSDEGVDMQSDCETDSLEDEGSYSTENGGDKCLDNVRDHQESEHTHESDSEVSVEAATMTDQIENISQEADDQSKVNSSSTHPTPEDSRRDAPITPPDSDKHDAVDGDDSTKQESLLHQPGNEHSEVDQSNIQSRQDDHSKVSIDKTKERSQPCMLLVEDPFTPIKIEQVKSPNMAITVSYRKTSN